MPMAFWAAQTTAALDLLGVQQDYPHFKSYLTPHAAATRIQKAQHLSVIGCHRHILPSLCGPYKSRPGCPIVSDGYATAQNARYRSMLIDMYMDWLAILATSSCLNGNDRVSSFYWTRGSKQCFLTCFSHFSRYFHILVFS
jgi:hypothetical protein